MSDTKKEEPAADPLQTWRTLRDAGMDAWAKAMVSAVNTEEYAKTTGTMLDTYLTASIPFRQMLEKVMEQALQQVNMPTRADLIDLAGRLTNIEMRLDDLDAKLDELATLQARPSPTEKATKSTKKK